MDQGGNVEVCGNSACSVRRCSLVYRKKHAAEHEEQMRKEAERKARVEREKAVRDETARLEREAIEERRKRRQAKERGRTVAARELYDVRWKELLAPSDGVRPSLSFNDIPWPVLSLSGLSGVSLEEITPDAISSFIFMSTSREPTEAEPPDRKEAIRETMLRFHPDKFEGRIMSRVQESDMERVKEAAGVVVRVLNSISR